MTLVISGIIIGENRKLKELFSNESTNDIPTWLLILKILKIINYKCNSHAMHEANK